VNEEEDGDGLARSSVRSSLEVIPDEGATSSLSMDNKIIKIKKNYKTLKRIVNSTYGRNLRTSGAGTQAGRRFERAASNNTTDSLAP
jgi:hypothetical protein